MALDVTPRSEKPAKPAWVKEITKKIIPKKEGSFVKAIRDEVGRLRKGKVYIPIKKPPVIIEALVGEVKSTMLISES